MIFSQAHQIIMGGEFAQLRVVRNDGFCWGRVVRQNGVNLDVELPAEVDLYDEPDAAAVASMEALLQSGQAVLVDPLSSHYFDWLADLSSQEQHTVLQTEGLQAELNGNPADSEAIRQRCQLLQPAFSAGWDTSNEDMHTVDLPNGWLCCVTRVEVDKGSRFELSVLDPRGVDFGAALPFPDPDLAKSKALRYVASLASEEGIMPGDPWPRQRDAMRQGMN